MCCQDKRHRHLDCVAIHPTASEELDDGLLSATRFTEFYNFFFNGCLGWDLTYFVDDLYSTFLRAS
jgi:hypothetical protein